MQRTVAATSTFRESLIGLPISIDSSKASSSVYFSTKWAKLIKVFLRCTGELSDHTPLSNTFREIATARLISSASHSATWAITRPSAGLMQSKVLPEAASTYLPLIKACVRICIALARACHSSRDVGLFIENS